MKEDITRKDIDDGYKRNQAKNSYKNRIFSNKQSTTDEYTGERIFYRSRIGHTSETTANVDHVTPLNNLIKRYKEDIHDGKITINELKEVANSDYNLKMTSNQINTSKGAQTNTEYLIKQMLKNGKPESVLKTYNMLTSQAVSEVGVRTNINVMKMGNVIQRVDNHIVKKLGIDIKEVSTEIGTVVASGMEAGIFAITVSSIQNFVEVGRGNKSMDEAIKDTVLNGGMAFSGEIGRQVIVKDISKITEKTALEFVGKIGASEVAMAAMVTNSVRKYLNDSFTANECVQEILLNGIAAYAIAGGVVLGGPAGAVVTTLVVGVIQNTILTFRDKYKLEIEKKRKRVEEFNRLLNSANAVLSEQKLRLDKLLEDEKSAKFEYLDHGIAQMLSSAMKNDAEGIAAGLNIVLLYFHEQCRFHSMEEFNRFFDAKGSVFVL